MNHQLSYSCLVPAPIEHLFRFHTDTHNLALITPPWIGVSIISMDAPLREGSEIVLRIKRFGLPTLWRIRIQTLDFPNTLTDRMIQGPFASFVHERRFRTFGEGQTWMDETITLALPLGALGALAFGWVRRDIDAMFAYRHRATQSYFTSNI